MFVGRLKELDTLRKAFASARSAFVPIWGRRRIGKTELIRRFLEDVPGVCFVGKEAPPALQQREFLRVAATALGRPILAQLQVGSWRECLAAVVAEAPGKIVLALDEFQWTAASSPELPSVLQELWDTEWSRTNAVMLVLCGSFVGFMEREVLGSRSPLFGRRTAQIHLQPFDLREARAFHPMWSLEEVARVRAVCGGVPAYLTAFSPDRSVAQSLVQQILDDHGPLRLEPEFLLREELRDVQNYYAVLMAVAGGASRARDIATVSGLPDRSLPYYLKQLTEIGYLRRDWPLTEKAPVPRHVHYRLADPLLKFWFRFVWPNGSVLAQLGAQRTFEAEIRERLPAFYGEAFEQLCRDALPILYAEEGVTGAFEVGSYWSSDVQIDVIGRRSDDWVDIGECRWGRVTSEPGLVRELDTKVRRYPCLQGCTVQRRLFTRQSSTADGVRWHGLESLYGEATEGR